MDYKKSYLFFHIGLIGGACIVFIGLSLSLHIGFLGQVITICGLIGMLGGMIQAFLFCRCPQCGALLKLRGKKPNCCHNCGCELDL